MACDLRAPPAPRSSPHRRRPCPPRGVAPGLRRAGDHRTGRSLRRRWPPESRRGRLVAAAARAGQPRRPLAAELKEPRPPAIPRRIPRFTRSAKPRRSPRRSYWRPSISTRSRRASKRRMPPASRSSSTTGRSATGRSSSRPSPEPSRRSVPAGAGSPTHCPRANASGTSPGSDPSGSTSTSASSTARCSRTPTGCCTAPRMD